MLAAPICRLCCVGIRLHSRNEIDCCENRHLKGVDDENAQMRRCCLVIIIQNTTKMPDTFLAIRDRDSPRGFADRNRSGQRILELLDGLAVLCCCSNIMKYRYFTLVRTFEWLLFIFSSEMCTVHSE